MTLQTISREEFDRRLQQSVEQMRQKNLGLEMQAAELEALVAQYEAVLARLETDAQQERDSLVRQRTELRNLLNELAQRTSAIAAAL